jgi:predicted NBD/HSP70 family sugar kinase
MNHQSSKLLNKYDILKLVTIQGPISRLQLQQITGLSKMTISNLVREYVDAGVIISEKKNGNSVGRKTEMLSVEPSSLLTLGIYIDNEIMKAGIIDLKGSILVDAEFPLSIEETEEYFLLKLLKLCDSVMSEELRPRLWGIGISSKGPIDIFGGSLLIGEHFPKMPIMKIVAPLEKRYNLPVYLDNDANVSALAELYFSDGYKYQNFIYVVVKEGIGSGIIIDRSLYLGSNGFSGELGHVIINQHGKPCHCGSHGCLEQYAGIPAVLAAYAQKTGRSLSWAAFEARVTRNEPAALETIDDMVACLATGLLSLINLVDPECIYLGGKIGFSLDRIITTIKSRLQERFAPIGKVELVPSKFQMSSSFIGTGALVMERNCHVEM